jgi:hypothetical protein
MPKNKDLKRLVRTRMKKTGESYTAARARVVAPAPKPAPKGPSLAELAGQSDAAVQEKTGRTWNEWTTYLDERGAATLTHGEIAKLAHAVPGVSGWWAQAVAVGYERIRGLRARYQRSGGQFEATKTRTFPVGVATLYAAFAKKPRRARWLPIDVKVRALVPNKTVHITWPDETSVEAYFTAKGPKKSNVSIAHRKLKSREAVLETKAAWAERFTALAELLSSAAKKPR